MRLAGTYHPIEYILFRVPELFPGIASSAAVYKSESSIVYVKENVEIGIDIHSRTKFQSFRSSSNRFKWVDNDFFSKSESQANIQRSLIDENAQQSLLIPVESNIDGNLDLVLLNFENVIKVYSVDKYFKELSSSEKNLIGELIYNMLNAEAKRVFNEKELLTKFNQVQQNHISQKGKLQEDINELQRVHKNHVEQFVYEIIGENSMSKQLSIHSNENFVIALSMRKLSYKELKNVVNESIETAYHLSFGSSSIELSDVHLPVLSANLINTSQKEDDKTLILLNRYEEAADKIIADSLIVNGKNIAAYLDPSVSPPAITDAIKKHGKRISFLIKRYPDRWSQIKKGLRPIHNLVDQNPLRKVI